MSAVAKLAPVERDTAPADPLARLREPFPAHQVSKLPKPTAAQTKAVRDDFKAGARCKQCGAWHHPEVVHLDYVGHAALTDRLLDTDPQWFWEPMALRDGLPAFDQTGGLWIKLTVCGVSRLGYGNAAIKPNMDPGNREKEVIGDALRNAAMRFGAALDLWHKGDLHVADEAEDAAPEAPKSDPRGDRRSPEGLAVTAAKSALIMCETLDELKAWGNSSADMINSLPKPHADEIRKAYRFRAEALKETPKATDAIADDEIPY